MTDSPLASAEWLALVAAMRFAPDDDTPRLVAADWLTETGRPELSAWGEFIRLQCEGAREERDNHRFTESCDCVPCKCERKATMVYDRWSSQWMGHAWQMPHPSMRLMTEENHRGFPLESYFQITISGLAAEPLLPTSFDRIPVDCVACHIYLTRRLPRAKPGAPDYYGTIGIEPKAQLTPSGRIPLDVSVNIWRFSQPDPGVSSGIRTVMRPVDLYSAIRDCFRDAVAKIPHPYVNYL
jgi:uncharacterized protein (TIGR02996 family)